MHVKAKEVNSKKTGSEPAKKHNITVKVTEISKSAAEFLNTKKAKKIRQIIFRCFFLAFAATFFTLLLIDHLKYDLEHFKKFTANNDIWSKLLWTGVYIVVVLTVLYFISFLLHLFAGGSKRRKTILSMIASFVRYIGYIVLFVLILSALGVNTAALLAGTAVLGLVIGLGAQSLVSDILSGVFMVFEDNIQVGDIITYNGFRGEVVNIGIRTTRTRSVTGDVNVINNSELRNFVNMSKHRSLAISDVTVAYSENLEKVEEIIREALPKIANKLTSITEGPDYIGVAEFTERGLILRIKAKCAEENRMQLTRDMNREFKLLFDKHKIKIAVQQIEITNPKPNK